MSVQPVSLEPWRSCRDCLSISISFKKMLYSHLSTHYKVILERFAMSYRNTLILIGLSLLFIQFSDLYIFVLSGRELDGN